MKDVELEARLRSIGMSPDKARETTRQIRDRLHPVAAVATAKIAQQATAALAGYYDEPGMGDLGWSPFKSLKRLGKNILKVGGKLVKPVLSVAGTINPLIGAGVVAGGFALKALKGKKKRPAPAVQPSVAVATEPTAAVPAAIAQDASVVAQQVIAQGQPPALVTPTIPNVPPGMIPFGSAQGFAPVATGLTPQQDATAGILQSLLSRQGTNMVSPESQQILSDVAAEGVEATPAGPSKLPGWVIPAGIGVGGLLLFMAMRKRR
jgi:hypothetical protein